MTMTRKKCWICGRPVYSKISDICRPCEQAWRVLVLKEREKDNIDECYGCIWKGTHRDLFPCSECRGSGKEGPDWYSPAGEPLVYRDDASAGENAQDSSDLISRQDALKPFCIAPDGTRIPEVDCDNFPVEFSVEFIKKHLLSLPSAKPTGDLISRQAALDLIGYDIDETYTDIKSLPSVEPKTEEENELKFYYVESIDDYWVGRRLDNFYYANWHEGLGFVWSHSRYLPWGEHIVDENTLWKEHTYPSEPIEIPFTEWIVGFVKKYFAEPKTGRDCTDFVLWLMGEVMDEENWQLNAVANGEIICRKLKKLGLLDVVGGYYVETQKTGKWIRNDNGTYSCCVCQSWIPEEQHGYARYCLHCGAKMKGANE